MRGRSATWEDMAATLAAGGGGGDYLGGRGGATAHGAPAVARDTPSAGAARRAVRPAAPSAETARRIAARWRPVSAGERASDEEWFLDRDEVAMLRRGQEAAPPEGGEGRQPPAAVLHRTSARCGRDSADTRDPRCGMSQPPRPRVTGT